VPRSAGTVAEAAGPRVGALVAAGDGVRFDAHKDTPMRERFSLGPESGLAWVPLAREAPDFVQAAAEHGLISP
jgi:hypothetical protein